MMLCNSVRVAFILLKLGLTHLNLLSVRFFCRVCFGKSHLFLKSKVPLFSSVEQRMTACSRKPLSPTANDDL